MSRIEMSSVNIFVIDHSPPPRSCNNDYSCFLSNRKLQTILYIF